MHKITCREVEFTVVSYSMRSAINNELIVLFIGRQTALNLEEGLENGRVGKNQV